MATLADITINDGRATPVARVFSVSDVSNRVITYAAKEHPDAHTFEGRPTISIGNRPLTASGGNYKCTLRVKVPKLDEGYSEPESSHNVVGVCTANIDFIFPSNMTEQQIQDTFAYVKNVLNEAQVSDAVLDQILPY